MIDTRRSQFVRQSLARAERMPASPRNRVIVEQTRRTLERALRSEATDNAGRPK